MELIITHVNADFDALASLIAASKIYPKAKMVLPGSAENDVREFLNSSSFQIPLLKTRQINLKEINKLIIVDTRLANRIGKFKELLKNKEVEVHIYDHHPPQEEDIRGKVHKVLPLGSTIAILLKIIQKRKLAITPLEASIMVLGIYEDTGFLTYPTTTPADINALSYLLKKGANLNLVTTYLKQELNAEQISLLNDLIKRAKDYLINDEEIVIATAKRQEYVSELAILAHKMMDIQKIKVLFLIIQIEKKIYLIARSSLKKVEVNKILSYLGGGGHKSAASATLFNISIKEVRKRLIKVLEKEITPEWTAERLLKKKIRTVRIEENIAKAYKKAKDTKQSVLPVVDKEKNLLGLVSCIDIKRAYGFGLLKNKIKEYLYKNIILIDKKTSLRKIKMFLIDYNIIDLPVVENGKLCGLINKEHLINILKKAGYEDKEFFIEKEEKDNLKHLMEEKIPYGILNLLKKIGEVSSSMNYNSYIVGGFVRDLLLGVENYDLDIVIEGDGINFANRLGKQLRGVVKSHKKFNTAVVILPENFKIDIASARIEDYEYPGALPKVGRGSIKEDLKRRDFTINAMAIQLNAPYYGNLIDFFGGKRDIIRKKIRVLHSLSFLDDPTRIFRAIRFEKRLNFQIEEATESFIKKAIRENLYTLLSPQRVKDEFILILSENKPFKPLKHLERLNILSYIHPLIKVDQNLNKLLGSINKIRFEFEIIIQDRKLKVWLLNLLALVDNLEFSQIKEIILKFRFLKEEENIIAKSKEVEEKLIQILIDKNNIKNSFLYFNLYNLSLETIFFILAKIEMKFKEEESNRAKKRVMNYFINLQNIKPLVDGKDIKELGIKPGPIYSEIIRSILLRKLDGKLKKKEEEIRYILDNYLNI
jgi:tRNA nucleotidyltransferase (CCA-adding enzyme)